MNVGIILAGGSGLRFGSSTPKQYQKLNGKEVVSFVIDAFKKSNYTDRLLVVSAAEYIHKIEDSYGITAIQGGNSRNSTIYNGIMYVKNNIPTASKVIFADSVRPLLTSKYIDRVFELLDYYDGVITVEKITDSLHLIGKGIVDRDNYRLIQTPEAFRMQLLEKFDKESQATAIVKQFEGNNIFYCEELLNNLKITYQKDLKIAKALLEEKND